ncbi:MAG: hypothetical protein KHZ72_04875 [Lachnospiraceae bacterium]|nr:hypothetical protein [Lachnospiraceae bacterium]
MYYNDWFPPPVPDDVFQQICADMEKAEQSGQLDQMFQGECQDNPVHQSKEVLLSSIKKGMKLYKSTFKKAFAYDMTTPGFVEDVISKLEEIGCTKAREHSDNIVAEWQQEHDEMMKNVAEGYSKQNYERKAVGECKEKEKQKKRGLSREYVASQILKW